MKPVLLGTLLIMLFFGTVFAVTRGQSQVDTVTLDVKAALVYRNGDVKPVARTTFLVLDADLESLLKSANVGCELPVVFPSEERNGCPDVIRTFLVAELWKDQTKAEQIKALVQTHVVKSSKTDFEGMMTIDGLPLKKKLWLFGELRVSSLRRVWHVPVEFNSPGSHKLLLDNDNLR